ncbi:MAG: hypothetical protein H7Y43_14355 [Akkermansiaceae bacterium]|nr:hypothetical protein [Verrucomicrobiales bacterium]
MNVALVGGLFLFPQSLRALDPEKSVYQFNCQNWTRQGGLPSDKVSSVAQTRDGYIWLGIQNGLIRFDGLEFKVVPIALPQARGQDIRMLERSRSGGLWFAIHEGSFGEFDGKKFLPLRDERWNQPGISATVIHEGRDGVIWTAGEFGLGRWAESDPVTRFSDLAKTGIVLSLAEDRSGRIWVGTVEHGLFYWENNQLLRLPDDTLNKRNIFALAADPQGRIWVGTGQGLLCYDSKGQPIEIPPVYSEIKSLLVDRHGVLWVGTSGLGLARYHNGQFTYLTKADGLGSDHITSLFEDVEGSLWIGTRDGLSQLTDLKFPIFSHKDGLTTGAAHSVAAAPGGGLWIGTSGGESYFDGKTMRNFTNASLLPNRYVKREFLARNGELYVVDGDKNVNVLVGDSLQIRYPCRDWASAFTEDDESVVVAVGSQGVFRIKNRKFEPYVFKQSPPEFFWVNNMCLARDGAIWVASNNGIFRIKDGNYKQWSLLEGVSWRKVHWIFEDDDGAIWAGLASGMTRIKNGQVRNITRDHGLEDVRIYSIVPDNHGDFWIASGRGIIRNSRQNLNDVVDGKSPRVQGELFDGLESIKFNDRTEQEYSGCKTSDGRIWFPNPQGVVMIDPKHYFTNAAAPLVSIEEIRVDGQSIEVQPTLAIPGKPNRVEFSFSARSFISHRKVKTRYQLQGFDPVWLEAGSRKTALYSGLPPGKYKFHVQACNADGVWNTTGASVIVELPPPFYNTAWFRVLCGLASIVALLGGYRWKVRHMEAGQRKLQEENDLLEAKVGKRTLELAKVNGSLQSEIEGHKATELQLKHRTESLEKEISERNRMQLEIEKVHRELVETSRQAGMAEVATGVLHNVGNVLNSVNVSASLISDRIRNSKLTNVGRVAGLLQSHAAELGDFMSHDPKGQRIPAFLDDLAKHLETEQAATLEELSGLNKNIEHIKDIVSMQQNYAKVAGVTQTIKLLELVEDALRMNEGALQRHDVRLIRDYEPSLPEITVDKHKIMQILINLIRNAKYACDDSGRTDKHMIVRISTTEDRIRISIIDNGVGIPAENLTRIFNHGFTTRKNGHGFGLHSGALAAKELGGALIVHSDGPGKGASFTLELPKEPPRKHGQGNGNSL